MSTTIPGLDVSHYQGTPDFARVKAAGFQFVYAKATEGTNVVDPQFAANRIAAKRAGLVFGAYHFGRGGDVGQEAAHFAAVVGTLQVGEFAVLDAEVPQTPPPWCRSWLDVVTGYWATKPLIYTYDSMRKSYDWTPVSGADYGLIAAKYDGTQTPTDSSPWAVEAMRQYSSSGSVPGIAGAVDLDEFYGDLTTLARYCRQGAPTPPPPPPVPAPQPVPPAPSFDARTWRVSLGGNDAHLPSLQAWANRMFPGYRSTPIGPLSTHYGPQTQAFIKEFGSHVGVPNDGADIGPRIAAALYQLGWRG